jgi:LysM repeat protein
VELYPLLTPTDDPRVAGHRLYTVVRGDTLSDLARRFGVTVASITRANDLDPGRVLTPGQPLYVPPRGAAQDGSAPSLPSRR